MCAFGSGVMPNVGAQREPKAIRWSNLLNRKTSFCNAPYDGSQCEKNQKSDRSEYPPMRTIYGNHLLFVFGSFSKRTFGAAMWASIFKSAASNANLH